MYDRYHKAKRRHKPIVVFNEGLKDLVENRIWVRPKVDSTANRAEIRVPGAVRNAGSQPCEVAAGQLSSSSALIDQRDFGF